MVRANGFKSGQINLAMQTQRKPFYVPYHRQGRFSAMACGHWARPDISEVACVEGEGPNAAFIRIASKKCEHVADER